MMWSPDQPVPSSSMSLCYIRQLFIPDGEVLSTKFEYKKQIQSTVGKIIHISFWNNNKQSSSTQIDKEIYQKKRFMPHERYTALPFLHMLQQK